ncbi:MAG: hypothetical protein GY811_20935 [Myxococcales bacterium]|nr:hypothetical protein [Myxococcales bacterium]
MGLPFVVRNLSVAFAIAITTLGCGPAKNSQPRTRVATAPSKASEVALVVTERADRGGRLVGVALDGSRLTELTELSGKAILDRSPIVTGNGRWVVFASNRQRDSIGDTSLWRVSSEGGQLLRVSKGEHIDRDPRISPDGKWLYFCSNRSGSFDLYRAQFDDRSGTVGEVALVLASDGQILSPTISPDGQSLAYMEVGAEGESRLWTVSANGEGKAAITDGPADMTPAWGPSGTIAFAARVPGRDDADVYLMPAVGGDRTMLLDTTIADETGPRWSADGRYIFAIGVYRSATDGRPLLGSVIALDREEQVPKWRALHDPATVETRIGLGLVPRGIDAEMLRKNREYKEALTEVLSIEALRNERRRSSASH